MALILGNTALVLNAYAVLVNETPGAAALAEHQAYIAANGVAGYKTALNGVFAGVSTADLATRMLANLGLTTAWPTAQADAVAYLTASSNRVEAMMVLADKLYNYTGTDAKLVAASTAYKAEIAGSYTYSIDPSHVAGQSLADGGSTGSQTFDLTAGTDRITGTAGADIFNAFISQNSTAGGVSNTLSSADKVAGGAGSDHLYAELVPEFFGVTGNNQIDVQARVSGVETIEFEARDAGGSSNASSFSGSSSNLDGSNTVTVDAKYITGVNSIGSTFSDGDLVIENLTTLTDEGVARNTEAITVTMDHTDNFNTDGDASDLHVYFDDDYLLAGKTSSSTLELRLVNAFELATNNTPLVAFTAVSFTVGSTLVVTPITAAMKALTGAAAYAALVVGIQAQLATQGITGVTVTSQPVRDVLFSDNVGSFVQGAVAGNYTPIQVVSTGATLTKGQAQLDNTTLDFNGLNTQTNTSETGALPITVNIDLDKVGRAGEGGDLIIGGKEHIYDPVNTSASKLGITVFKVDVLGTADRPSNLGTLSSTNGKLESVYISTDAAYVAGTHASLTIRDGFGNTSGDSTTSDLKLVNADAFLGDLFLGKETAVVDLDTLTAQGGGNVYFNAALTGSETNQPYSYTTGAGKDTVIVSVDGDATDYAKSSLNVSTGAGDDSVTIKTVFDAPESATNEILNQAILKNITVDTGDGNDTVSLDAAVAAQGQGNVLIKTGAGADVIYTDGSAATYEKWAFNFDDVRAPVVLSAIAAPPLADDLPGVQTSMAYLGGATVRVTLSGAGIAAIAAGGGVMALGVPGATAFVDGYESSVVIGSLVNGNTYFGDQRDINAAIVKIITEDAVLSKLLSAKIMSDNTLVVTSLTRGAFDAKDLEVTLVQDTAKSYAHATAVLSEAETVFQNSLLTLTDLWGTEYTSGGFLTANAIDPYLGADNGAGKLDINSTAVNLYDYYTGLGVDNAVTFANGTASAYETDNVINGGTGNDVIVLSTDAVIGANPGVTFSSNNSLLNGASNETIVLEGSFGSDTVMNFTADFVNGAAVVGTYAGGGGDFLNYASYLTSKVSPSGSSQSTVTIPVTMDNTVITDAAATLVAANSVVVVQYDNTVAADTFAGLNASVIAALFNADNSATTLGGDGAYGNFDDASFTVKTDYDDAMPAPIELVSGAAKSIVMVENADNLGEYKVFEMSWYAGVTDGASTHQVTVTEVGSLDFGTSLTGLTAVNLVGSVPYTTLLTNATWDFV
jgi:hypothetical protein